MVLSFHSRHMSCIRFLIGWRIGKPSIAQVTMPVGHYANALRLSRGPRMVADFQHGDLRGQLLPSGATKILNRPGNVPRRNDRVIGMEIIHSRPEWMISLSIRFSRQLEPAILTRRA